MPDCCFYINQGTAFVPAPSGDATTDTAAIAAAQSQGTRYVEFQSGTYKINPAGLTMNSNQILVGHGASQTICAAVAQATGSGMLSAVGKSDIGVRGIGFDYANLRERDNLWSVINLQHVDGVNFSDVSIVNYPRFGFSVNAGSQVSFSGGRIVRSSAPLNASGLPISSGQQNQAILVSEFSGSCTKFIFKDIYSIGSAHDVSGSFFIWENCEVNGFDFGCGFTTEMGAGCHHQEFYNCKAHAGRGTDINSTVCGGFEIWAPYSVLDANEAWDNDGYCLTLGGKYSRIVNNKWRDIGRIVTAAGTSLRLEGGGSYSAGGSHFVGNTYSPPDGNSSWGAAPISWQVLDPNLGATFDAEDVGDFVFTSGFPATTRWGSPGYLLSVHQSAFSGAPGPTVGVIGTTVAGSRRERHVAVGAVFVGDSGQTLPSGLRLFAEIDATNSVLFYLSNINGSSASIGCPAGTYYARIISIL